jgi:hypothetical protein
MKSRDVRKLCCKKKKRRDEEQRLLEAILQEEDERLEDKAHYAIMMREAQERLERIDRASIEWLSQNHVAWDAFKAKYRSPTGFLVLDKGCSSQASDPVRSSR